MSRILFASLMGIFLSSTSWGADQEQIDDAVQKGAVYLRSTAGKPGWTGEHGNGEVALAGMALLASGAPANDAAVMQIAKRIRAAAPNETKTYNLALYILFLDKLAQPDDRKWIQLCGVRLYNGMNASGGWGYDVPVLVKADGNSPGVDGPPRAAPRENLPAMPELKRGFDPNTIPPSDGEFIHALQDEQQPPDTGFPEAPKAESSKKNLENLPIGKLDPMVAQLFINVRRSLQVHGRATSGDDNSNTQFGLIGLYVASGHGLPVQDAFLVIEQRFLLSQNRADGGWSYTGGDSSSATMTCAGLLGLAVGSTRHQEAAKKAAAKPTDPADPFFNPPDPEKTKAKSGDPTPNIGGSVQTKLAIAIALKALGVTLNRPVDQTGAGNYLFYFLWSVERVCVAYGLDTLGGVNWHDWGCRIILAPNARNNDGSWQIGGHSPTINSSFAILFLTKSNFAAELSSTLTGKVNDPGRSELRGGGMAIATPPKGSSTNTTGTTPVPELPEIVVGSAVETIVKSLVTAQADWKTKLAEVRDAKGGDNTDALVKAMPLLTQSRQQDARAALANRLTRMTAGTLRTMLSSNSPELRRAAALACAMKDDSQHIPDLIAMIDDDSDFVIAAVRAGLKSLTGQDFGPKFPANAAAKAKAAQAWKAWQAKQ